MASLVHLPITASVDDVVEVVYRDGAVIVQDMLSTETLKGFRSHVESFLARTPFGEVGFAGAHTRRCNALLAKSSHTPDLLLAPHFLGAAERILPRPFCTDHGSGKRDIYPTIQVSATQAIEIWPGQPAQHLHRDDALHHTRHPGPETLVLCIYAITRFTNANGATAVIPGSHRWPDDRVPRPEEAVPAQMPAGSGLIYLGSTYHGGGPNLTPGETRIGVNLSYTLGYLRQEENQYLAVPRETVKRLPRRVQELMGYVACPPFCGWVEMNHPIDFLEEGMAEVAGAKNIL